MLKMWIYQDTPETPLPFDSFPYPTRTICTYVRSVNHVTTNEKRLTIFYEYGALSHACFALVEAPL